ncbi:uncharacterized protein [Anoplolepis gracilipes]|uniref:uncharacterized protein n=1 Tax=Anoplolepis gracilipes TaxID=354296 RepID=UPI003BA19ED3
MKGRDDERTSVTPGPGDYEHETKKSPVQIHNERTREAKRAAAKQPRFLEALYQQKLRQNFPAPNHYDLLKNKFYKYKHIRCKCDRHLTKPLPVKRTAKKIEKKFMSDTPGPGKYEIAIRQICHGSILNVPFGTFSARFKKIVYPMTPGPADYHTEVGNLSFESTKRFKKYEKMTDYIKFYKTLTLLSSDTECTFTDEREVIDEEKCLVYHAVFKSRVDRFPKIHDDVPDPGAYEALSAFKANRDRCDFLCRQLIPSPFGSRACRFPMTLKGDFHVPGPAHYNLSGDISKNIKNGVICYAPRERKEDIKAPGPLHYHIHPYIASSVLKKSFNVTLDKSKIIKPINEIQTPWQHRRSKKVLRWFAVPRKRYQHCTSV